MMANVVDPNFVADWEDVARMLFSPLFISEGVLSQRAFMLEDASGETYISVLRIAMECFEADMEGIKREGNTLYGYAQMNVGRIRASVIPEHPEIKFDVLPRNAGKRKSHAGIFTTIDNKRVKGGMPQTPARMLARMSLVNIAQSNIHQL
jgi:hypothetical protein